jgi:NADH-quinone oxidoreductase subunit K
VIGVGHYVVLSLVLGALGLVGLMVRRNFVTVLMCIELILNAANLNFIAFSRQLGDLTGQVFAVFVITIAAAEAAIGLGIIVALVRLKQTVQLDRVNVMQG